MPTYRVTAPGYTINIPADNRQDAIEQFSSLFGPVSSRYITVTKLKQEENNA